MARSGPELSEIENSAGSKPRVAVVTNIIVHYRSDFWARIFRNPAFEVKVFCQSEVPGVNLKSVNHQFPENVVEIPYLAMKGEKICWQKLPLRRLLRDFDIYIFMGNPRVLSTLLYATLFRIIGRPVIIWGQVHTAGAGRVSEKIRLAWWRCFRYQFVYTDSEADVLRKSGYSKKIIVAMNNGLDQATIETEKSRWNDSARALWASNQRLNAGMVLLSCTRLEPKNRLDVVIRALPELIGLYPHIVWCVIGEGVMKEAWRDLADTLGVSPHIRWLGAIYDEHELAPWFMRADLFIHPGAVGLSLMHAFGYGLPVITHGSRLNHMPEISALVEGETGCTFAENNENDLSRVVQMLIDNRKLREKLGENALSCARDRYNTSVMSARFIQLLKQL